MKTWLLYVEQVDKQDIYKIHILWPRNNQEEKRNQERNPKFLKQQFEDEEDDEEIGPPTNEGTQNLKESIENGGANHESLEPTIPII